MFGNFFLKWCGLVFDMAHCSKQAPIPGLKDKTASALCFSYLQKYFYRTLFNDAHNYID